MTGFEPLRVVFLSHTARGGPFVVGSHHLARELATAGHEVLHLSNPFSLAHLPRARRAEERRRFQSAVSGPQRGPHGVMDYVPATALPMTMHRFDTARASLATALPRIRATVQRLGYARPDLLLVDQPLFHAAAELFRPGRVVFRPTDIAEAGAHRTAMRRQVGSSDVVVATSEAVAAECRAVSRCPPVHVLENGVDWDHVSSGTPSPRVGCVYVGALDSRFSWPSLRVMAENNPAIPFSIYGPVVDQSGTRVPANVRLMGPLDYRSLPDVLARARVGLLPMVRNESNVGRSPMKYYEYLTAGLNVVATRTDTLARRNHSGVWLTDVEDCSDQLREAYEAPTNDVGRQEARAFSWRQRSEDLLSVCLA